MRVTALVAAGFMALATARSAPAADFSRVDLRPYLLVSSHLIISSRFNPEELTYQDQQQFITQGGAIFSSRSIQVGRQIASTDIYRGIATPRQVRDLRDALNAASIGIQRSCEIKTIGSRDGYFDVTWTSIRGRRNTLRVVVTFTGGSGLPPCREPLAQLLADLQVFELAILQNPDTELLLAPR